MTVSNSIVSAAASCSNSINAATPDYGALIPVALIPVALKS
jgi:hypothetical protein